MASAVTNAVENVTKGVKNLVTGDTPKGKKKDKKKGAVNASGPDEQTLPPAFFDHRIQIFDKLKAKYDAEVAAKPRGDIIVTFPDGKTTVGKSWETSPADIVKF
jgi:threonyl-tRNA synthetase